jgi:hypothetical protein
MTKLFVIFFLLLALPGSTQNKTKDSLFFYDDHSRITFKVNAADYFHELRTALPDSVTLKISNHLTSIQDSIISGKRNDPSVNRFYYLSMGFYDRSLHGLVFDHILHKLLITEKLLLLRDDSIYNFKQLKIKVKRVYCCHNIMLYCGKDWVIYHNKNILTRLDKSKTAKAYVARSCF